MRTANPAFKKDEFQPAQTWNDVYGSGSTQHASGKAIAGSPKHMTIAGTVTKTSLLLTMCVATAMVAWNLSVPEIVSVPEGTAVIAGKFSPMLFTAGGAIVGLVFALICSFAPKTAPVTAPAYALSEGFFVGGISTLYATRYATADGMLNTGLVLNAGVLTFGILGGLLAGYGFGIIRPGPVFKKIVITATLGLCLYTILALVLGMTGLMPSMMEIYNPSNGGLFSIGFSLFVVALASSNLVLDFDFIEQGARNQAPKHMEWYGGFGLLVTLVWLYVEILRLLAKIQSRD